MKITRITPTQYNKLLNIDEIIKQKGIKIIKSKTMLYIGLGVFVISIITPFTNWVLMPLSFAICGFSLFDIKHKYADEFKRIIKNKLRGFKPLNVERRFK